MEGPTDYLKEHFEEVLSGLGEKDLTPLVFYHSSEGMSELPDGSVQLVVTSPPYPMIEMWDGLFEKLLHLPKGSFAKRPDAFDISHKFLGKIWVECYRVLEKGGFLCVNIGDATRTIKSDLFYPPNAYVTLDCEYILLLRKGSKRAVRPGDSLRYASQYSKKERDVWFSQIWDFRGTAQDQPGTAPFPDELPYRLIRMFSSLGETVLDPFLGTGRTARIARALGRKGIGYEFNKSLKAVIDGNVTLTSPNPKEVLGRLLRLYEAADLMPKVMGSNKLSNLEDKTLSAYR